MDGRPPERPGRTGPPSLWAVMAAAREMAAERGHALEGVATEAGVRLRLIHLEVSESEVSLAELAELSRGLGVRLSELIAAAERIEGERGET
jgi:hypothetical protein